LIDLLAGVHVLVIWDVCPWLGQLEVNFDFTVHDNSLVDFLPGETFLNLSGQQIAPLQFFFNIALIVNPLEVFKQGFIVVLEPLEGSPLVRIQLRLLKLEIL
jgi:peptidyl-tRNA hydrolase